jgi:transposase
VGTPRSKLKGMERQLLEGTWTQVREEVEAQLVPLPGGSETYVLCRSTARREKERAIRRRFSGRMERALTNLAQRVEKGPLKDRSKIERRLGKIQERYGQVADLYEACLSQTEGRWVLRWNLIEERRAWREAREGAYLLRTNLEGAAAEELWTKYIQLTEAEAAFRALKSELSIRPLFHQLEPRVKAHILVAFLGYSLWVTLKHLLRRKNSDCSPSQALALLATIQSADIVLPTTDGREIRLRRVAALTAEQQKLLTELNISLPDLFNLNFQCSVDSAIA